jgi:hypothetical protein
MSFAFASGHLCLQEWDEPLLADHIVSLLLDLREVSTPTLARPILIIVTRPTAFAKASLPEVLQTALPAILEGCADQDLERTKMLDPGAPAPRDAWGNSFQWQCSAGGVRVTSAGPDLERGSEDDIVVPKVAQ